MSSQRFEVFNDQLLLLQTHIHSTFFQRAASFPKKRRRTSQNYERKNAIIHNQHILGFDEVRTVPLLV